MSAFYVCNSFCFIPDMIGKNIFNVPFWPLTFIFTRKLAIKYLLCVKLCAADLGYIVYHIQKSTGKLIATLDRNLKEHSAFFCPHVFRSVVIINRTLTRKIIEDKSQSGKNHFLPIAILEWPTFDFIKWTNRFTYNFQSILIHLSIRSLSIHGMKALIQCIFDIVFFPVKCILTKLKHILFLCIMYDYSKSK